MSTTVCYYLDTSLINDVKLSAKPVSDGLPPLVYPAVTGAQHFSLILHGRLEDWNCDGEDVSSQANGLFGGHY